jgi:hypothetical protein
MNVSTADLRNCLTEFHETWWSYRYMFLVDPKVFLKMADILKILKTQNCSSNGDLSLCQILCLYHYPVRSYQH